jgi:arylsulfatase
MSPNILLVVLDAARAQNLQLYGHVNETTPYLSSFGTDATVYTQARAPSTWSLPSHTCMFTGLEVPEHGLTSRNDRLAAGHTVWESLREQGYDTGVFSENPFITSDTYGLARGFDEVVTGLSTRRYPFPDAANPNAFIAETGRDGDYLRYLHYAAAQGKPVRSVANAMIRQLELSAESLVPASLRTRVGNSSAAYVTSFLDWQAGRSNWAACLNLTDVHHPYTPTSPHNRWGGETLRQIHDGLGDPRWDFHSGRQPWWKRQALTGLYDGCIHQIDTAIETMLETLADRGQLDDTLVVVTADHGEGFGERSRVRPSFRIAGHSGGIHELLLHVPLVVKFPEQTDGERIDRVATLTQFRSIVHHLLDGDDTRDGFVPDGPVVAVNHVAGQFETPPTNFEEYRDEMDILVFSGTARAVYHDRDGGVRKFAQWDDDTAVVDAVDAQNTVSTSSIGGVRDKIKSTFDSFEPAKVRESATADDMDDDTKRRLQDLGYL